MIRTPVRLGARSANASSTGRDPTGIIRRLAERQLTEAYGWYEAQVPGLGRDFLNRFAEIEARLVTFPESGPVVFLDYRRMLMRRFPYGVFYVIEAGLVIVAAVYHLARSPQSIKASLRP